MAKAVSRSSFYLLISTTAFASFAKATLIGDRQHGNTDTGFFYLFGPNITIIDPESGDVDNTLPGAASWGDTVYMRDQAQIKHYVFANDGEHSDLWVIDCDTQEVLSQVDTGDDPVHVYAIPSREEVWTHPDSNGTFDVIHMNDIDHLSHSHLKAHDEIPGHGKLLWDPNLQDEAFATNTNEPYIYQLDLEEKKLTAVVNMTLEGAPYQCNRTHGIGYSWVNDHLYVECSNPEDCTSEDYTDGTVCSGSMWEVDVESLKPVARLVSPALDAAYGNDFGVQGQVYVTPDEQFAIVPNKYGNYVHFLQPVKDGDTNIVEVAVTGNPGKVEFWPKGEDKWGADTSVADYFAIIAQEEQVEDSGIIMIDLEEVLLAFETEDESPELNVIYIPCGMGALYRPVARGGDFAITPIGATSEYGDYTGVAIIDLKNQEMKYELDIADVARVMWVPIHDDEQVADHEVRISALEDDGTDTMAEAALALAVVGCVAGLLALGLTIMTGRQAKNISGGEYKPFVCI